MHELFELLRLISAELLDGGLLLLLLDVSVLLGLGSAGQALPGKGSSEEVENNVANSLKIVSSRLLVTKMGVDRGVPGSSSEVLAVSEWDVLAVGRLVALSETEIDDVDGVLGLVVASHQEVVRLDVSMDDTFLVNDLDSLDHLHSDMQDSLKIELSAALLEQVFERLTEQVHHHDVVHLTVFSLLVSHEVEVRHGGLSSQLVNQFGLPEQHDVLLVLHGLLHLGSKVVSGLSLLDFVKLSESTASELLHNLVALI